MAVAWGRELHVFCNSGATALSDRALVETAGRPVRTIWTGAWEPLSVTAARVFATGEASTVDVPSATSGSGGVVRAQCSSLRDKEGRVVGVLVVLIDVPGESSVPSDRARFEAVFNQRLYTCLIDARGRVIDVNRSWTEATGVPRERVVGRGFWEQEWWSRSVDTQAWIKIGFAECTHGVRFSGQTTCYTTAGAARRIELSLDPVTAGSGELQFVVASALDVTDQHRSSEEMRVVELARETEARFRRMADAAPVLIWMSDADNRATWFNEQWLDFVGRPMERELDRGWVQNVHGDDIERATRLARSALAARRPFEMEFRLRRRDGEFRWVLNHGVPLFGHNGEFAGYIGSCVDITQRKQAELAVQRLAAIVESSGDAILAVDLDGYVTSWNRGAEILYGYAAVEIIGHPISLIIPPDRRAEDAEQCRRITGGETLEYLETRRMRRDGSFVDVSVSMSPIRDETGSIIGISRIARDITERRRIEAELRRREQVYRAIGESIDFGVWVADALGQMLYVSESLSRVVGVRVEECAGQSWTDLLHPDDAPRTIQTWQSSLRTGAQWEREHRFRGADGRWYPVLSRGVAVRDESGQITRWVGINLDITLLKQNEEALRESEERFRTLADNIAQFAWTADEHGRIFWFNRRWFEYTGLDQESGEPWEWRVVHHPDHADRVLEKFTRCIEEGVVWEDTFPLRRHDGVYRWFLSRAVPIRAPDGRVVRWFGTNTDITALREIEQQLERARDEAVGASRAKDDFLAALSHELRTPLNPVLLIASDAAEDPSLAPEIRADFAAIRKHVSLEARLIDDLLDLTRISRGLLSLEFGEHDVQAIVRDALATVAGDVEDKSITLTVDFQAAGCRVQADAVRLQQALWNVLKNAVKFTPVSGCVTVSTRALENARAVEIVVADTGIGIRADELERIFEAFSQGDHALNGVLHRFGGLGLGLTISRRVVELHAGRIQAQSAGAGRGARFVITLPLLVEAPRQETRPSPEPTALRECLAGRRVLLVEDHAPTRIALQRLLIRRGFEVFVAASVAEAQARIHDTALDLLVSDVGLPDGTGYDIMRECARVRGVPGIALTGYGMEHDIARSRDAGFSAHLTKPINAQFLDRTIADVLRDKTDVGSSS